MVVASEAGPLGIDTLLDEVAQRLGDVARNSGPAAAGLASAALELRRSEVEWTDRWKLLSQVLGAVMPVLVLLDDFKDNLSFSDGSWEVRDLELAALLGRWARHPGRSKLLITSPATPSRCRTTPTGAWLPCTSGRSPRRRRRSSCGSCPGSTRWARSIGSGPTATSVGIPAPSSTSTPSSGAARLGSKTSPSAWSASSPAPRDRRSPSLAGLRTAGGFDASLAEAVTLAVDDVVLRRPARPPVADPPGT